MLELDRAYYGDCLDLMGDIDDESIHLILCDLPYNKTKNAWDVAIPADRLWAHYERIIKPNGAILLFGQDKFTATMMMSNLKLHRYNLIWDKVLKSGFLNANKMPLRNHEDIMVFYKSPPTYNPQKTEGARNHTKGTAVGTMAGEKFSNRSYGDYVSVENEYGNLKFPGSILTFSKPHPSVALHGTQKPEELLRYLIRTYSNPKDIVLDNCCGTGSTLISAMLEDRHWIGIDSGYCDKKRSEYFGWAWANVCNDRIIRAKRNT